MAAFFIAFGLLVIGYGVYANFAEWVFKPSDRLTPAKRMADGVDYVEMSPWKAFLIQFLNTGGMGPIFGALMGAVFGPVAFFWIALGTIFAGVTHDYMAGMISCRMGGASLPEIVGRYLGKNMGIAIKAVSIIFLVLIGTILVTYPAELLAALTPGVSGKAFWTGGILAYYLFAAVVPIDKLIGRVYPVFGCILMLMVMGVGCGILMNGYQVPGVTLRNLHPGGKPVWPYMCITIAVVASSGFHALQTPMMARCIKSEWHGREVFCGAVILEGIICLIWAAAGTFFYGSTDILWGELSKVGPMGVVCDISSSFLGSFGGIMAVLGMVICSVASGGSAFRSARLILADWFSIEQDDIGIRLLLTAPLLIIGVCLVQLDLTVVYTYFTWFNQTLAVIVLWTAAAFLLRHRGKRASMIAALPACFLSAASASYILMSEYGLRSSPGIACLGGILFAAGCMWMFIWKSNLPLYSCDYTRPFKSLETGGHTRENME